MLDLNAQPDGLRIPDEMLGGVVDPELEEYIRDLIWLQLARGNDCLNAHAPAWWRARPRIPPAGRGSHR